MNSSGLTQSQLAALDAIGIERWVLRDGYADAEHVTESEQPSVKHAAAAAKVAPPQAEVLAPTDRWDALNERIRACTQCDLHATRTQAVCGVGNTRADCLIIGEAPGAEEDRQGEPFVGRAGQLLNEMLAAIGLDRQSVYIANILKCRPPKNRDPSPAESAACSPFLHEQIALLKPRLIVVVGKVAAQNLLNSDLPIGRMRGTVYRFGAADTPVVVTYHPAYLLRSPAQKAKSWRDLLLAQDILQGVSA